MIDFILICLAVLFLLLSVFFGWTTVSLIWSKIPFISTSSKRIQAMLEIADVQKGERVSDLGCGMGDVVFALEKKGAHVNGYEIVYPVFWIAQIRKKIKKSQVKIQRKDFFTVDFSKEDIIFCYLSPSLMKRFEEIIWPQLKPGTRIVSHAFDIKNKTPLKSIQVQSVSIYLYQKNECKNKK